MGVLNERNAVLKLQPHTRAVLSKAASSFSLPSRTSNSPSRSELPCATFWVLLTMVQHSRFRFLPVITRECSTYFLIFCYVLACSQQMASESIDYDVVYTGDGTNIMPRDQWFKLGNVAIELRAGMPTRTLDIMCSLLFTCSEMQKLPHISRVMPI